MFNLGRQVVFIKILKKIINIDEGIFIKKVISIFSFLLSILIAGIVYLTGGTMNVYANLMYIPIAVNSSLNKPIYAVVHAIFSGLLIGPLMPLDVLNNLQQPFRNWFSRVLIYLVISLVISYISSYYKKEYQEKIEKEKNLKDAKISMIHSLVKLAESRDYDTGEHVERVGVYSKFLAEKLAETEKYKNYITDNYIMNFAKTVPLHDIGKVSIPDEILLKPGKLTDEEFKVMETHTEIGADLILDLKKEFTNNQFLNLAEKIIRYHHERWDGEGYPEGLEREEIPLSARIMAVVDVYDALISDRPYKKAFSHEEAVEIVKEGRGSQFDPEIIDIFLENRAEIKEL